MAKFWTTKKNLVTGDHRNTVQFVDGTYETDDPDIVKMLREKTKIRALEIVELTQKEDEAPDKAKSEAIAPGKSKK
jgi:hypothetical protein